jgi:hypothetical protein
LWVWIDNLTEMACMSDLIKKTTTNPTKGGAPHLNLNPHRDSSQSFCDG